MTYQPERNKRRARSKAENENDVFNFLLTEFRMNLLWDEFQIDFYEREMAEPKVVGKAEAEERRGLYEKNAANWRRTIEQLEDYGKRKGYV